MPLAKLGYVNSSISPHTVSFFLPPNALQGGFVRQKVVKRTRPMHGAATIALTDERAQLRRERHHDRASGGTRSGGNTGPTGKAHPLTQNNVSLFSPGGRGSLDKTRTGSARQ